jgi:hypothetical protein
VLARALTFVMAIYVAAALAAIYVLATRLLQS